MAWRAIADDLDTHPKVRWLYDELGPERCSYAMALWALAQAEAGRRQARGLTPIVSRSYVVRALCHEPLRAAEDLVQAKLWEPLRSRKRVDAVDASVDVSSASTRFRASDAKTPPGEGAHKTAPEAVVSPASTVDVYAYAFHDDADYNPSTDPELARKKAKADRQRRWRLRNRAGVAQRDVDAEASTRASTRDVASVPIPDPRSPLREDLNSAAAARSATGDRARARGREPAAAARASPDVAERELREVLDEFAEAWLTARGERPRLSGKTNLKRARTVLAWARDLANGGGPVAVRFAIRRSAMNAAKTIENARIPIAVWAADPGSFFDADTTTAAERESELADLRAQIRERTEVIDRLNKNPTPEGDLKIDAHQRTIAAHRARIAQLEGTARDGRGDG